MYSSVGILLNQCEEGWLYDEEGALIPIDRLEEFSPSQLHADYQECINNNPAEADKLAKQLSMLRDIVSKAELEEERRERQAEKEEWEQERQEYQARIEELERQQEEKDSTESANQRNGEEERNDLPAEKISIIPVPRNLTQRISDPVRPAGYGGGVSDRSSGSQENGRRGEKVAYEHLRTNANDNEKVTWCNENEEMRDPWDITVEESDGTKTYVEVKSIRSRSPSASFEFSSKEREFALSHRQNYRVVCVFFDPDGQEPPELGESNDVKEEHFEPHKFLYRVNRKSQLPDAGEDD